MPRVRNFDEFLHVAYSAGVSEVEDADDDAFEVVPDELRWKVIAEASKVSSAYLAELIKEAGDEMGWTDDDLSYEVVGLEAEAAKLLRGQADPRDLTPDGLAILFRTVDLEPDDWRELLGQTVAAFASFPTGGRSVLGRTSGLAPDERARLLGEEKRDPVRAKREAELFVEEVIDSWTRLKDSKKKSPDES